MKLIFSLLFICINLFAVSVTDTEQVFKSPVLIGIKSVGSTADDSSILELNSTTKGFLIPRMTEVQRDAISTPATGLVIYNTDTLQHEQYNGSSWAGMGFADPLTTNGDIIIHAGSSTGRLGIGTENQVLTVNSSNIPEWKDTQSTYSDPLTTRGDVLVRNSSNETARLAIGSSGTVLTSDGTDVSWSVSSGATFETTASFNLITTNSGFETGDEADGWNSAGTPTSYDVQDTTKLVGNYSLVFDAGAADDAFYTDAITLDVGFRQSEMVLAFKQLGGDENLTVQVLDNDSNILLSEVLAAQATSKDVVLNFPTGASATSLVVKVIATADASVGYFDGFYILPASMVNISQVNQSYLYGSATWVGTTNCKWTTTSATFANFSEDTDCTSPTGSYLSGKASAPATKVPGISFSTMPAGEYLIIATGYFIAYEASGTAGSGILRFSDGTNSTSANYIGVNGGSGTVYVAAPSIMGRLSYSTAQSNVTIQLQAMKTAGDDVEINANEATTKDLQISVYRFPLESETVYSAQTDDSFASLGWYNVTNCAFAATGGTVLTDADCNAPTTTIGTATASDDNYQITKTLPPGKYKISANGNFVATYTSSDTACVFTISDGSNIIGTTGATAISTVNGYISGFSGEIEYASQASKTFQVLGTRTSGGGSCLCLAASNKKCSISIEPVTQAKPQPELIDQTFKQYDLTVSGTNWTTTRAVGLPYRTVDGAWRFKFNIEGSVSSGVTSLTLTITGIDFKTGTGYQAAALFTNVDTYMRAGVNDDSGEIVMTAGSASTIFRVSGDVELTSKPSFAAGINH